MPRYTCDPKLLLLGQSAISMLDNLQSDSIQPVLEKHGVSEIMPDEWYPVRIILDVMSDLADRPGSMTNLVAIGIAAADRSPLPEPVLQMPPLDFLKTYSAVYAQRHRDGDPGTLTVESVDDKHARLTMNSVYPDDLMYGLFYGFMRRLMPTGADFVVRYDDAEPRREQGGEFTVLHIEWD